jgi:1-aminocyclopropane-1-carboxylate deaminase/D-cysteine desulfhydrase-like pyridoxal-dependent ACC family enzyme
MRLAGGLPPRTELAALPTPLVPAPRLAAALGLEGLLVKRDDLTGFAIGGNKARPLEFLIADAGRQGADTLVTGGSARSNFCAAAAAAACRAGLSCHLVIAGEPSQPSPGLDLTRSWGASVSWTHSAERASVDAALPRAVSDLATRGRRPYLMPRGGATALGAVGYVLAAGELHRQLAERGLRRACVVVAVGSGGTMAGLVAGNALLGRPWRLVGASVSRPPQEAARRVLELARQTTALLTGAGRPGGRSAAREAADAREAAAALTGTDVELVDARGPGHGRASPDGRQAAGTAMRTEGLVVDPVYTAKALPVLARLAGEPVVVFWHTGGMLDAVAAAVDEAGGAAGELTGAADEAGGAAGELTGAADEARGAAGEVTGAADEARGAADGAAGAQAAVTAGETR